jgi:CheY-like chemotaxis protein
MNLCVNARDAMESGGDLTIKTTLLERAEVRRKFHDAANEEYVCLAVTDSGSGMDETTRARIFEPFFTTKGIGKGTGLGLSVVYGIVRSHHAQIEVDSELGKGTTFRVYFSAHKKPLALEGQTPSSNVQIIGGSETILYVEDEDMIMVPLRDQLEQYGYRVLVAQNGVEAVAVFAEHKDSIHIVLTDMGLPKMNGWEALRQMKRINPNIKAIVASGNIDLAKKREMVEGGVCRFVQKPYNAEEVLRALRSVLDDAEQTIQVN